MLGLAAAAHGTRRLIPRPPWRSAPRLVPAPAHAGDVSVAARGRVPAMARSRLQPRMPGPVRRAAIPTISEKVAALTRKTTFTNMGIAAPTGDEAPPATCGQRVGQFPAPIGLGATWSRVAAAVRQRVGEESRARNKSLVAAPVIDLMRTWHQGRQAEGFGEDPFLTGSWRPRSPRSSRTTSRR